MPGVPCSADALDSRPPQGQAVLETAGDAAPETRYEEVERKVDDEPSTQRQISDLVAEEHALRERLSRGEITLEEEHSRLAAVERELDQLWDLLRQRRSRSEFGQDVGEASMRPESTVEGYLQ
ncbi:DUF2630 family protein [Nocardioides sp. CN2-186]|uniref:DUF2630 family protein n=1 Tax=Nocardioides tweenelious TaxID=3156607 RepID=UPI0032B47528